MYLKKSLGQHFLHSEPVKQRIMELLGNIAEYDTTIEVGPGGGAITKHILALQPTNFKVIELDDRFAESMHTQFGLKREQIIHKSFLETQLDEICTGKTMIVGNFPYNISTQIIFHIIETEHAIDTVVGMFQKEVARRICSKHGSKEYGILSVLTQIDYDAVYEFDVPADAFNPPPKVISGVLKLTRKKAPIPVNKKVLKQIVKAAFNQRRKTLRNSLKSLNFNLEKVEEKILNLRPEQLSVADFVALAQLFSE